jgi:hypothetical protein
MMKKKIPHEHFGDIYRDFRQEIQEYEDLFTPMFSSKTFIVLALMV